MKARLYHDVQRRFLFGTRCRSVTRGSKYHCSSIDNERWKSTASTKSLSSSTALGKNDTHQTYSTNSTNITGNNDRYDVHPRYPHMFTPLDLGPDIEPLTNRVIMGSMHCGLEGHSIPKPLSYMMRWALNSEQKTKDGLMKESSGYTHEEEWAAYFAERARGGVSLMVTGGISPNTQGALTPFGSKLTSSNDLSYHQTVTKAVHDANSKSKILLQILHAGRYSVHPFLVAPSNISSPLSPFTPREMSRSEILSTVQDFVTTAQLAHRAGYDGIELMGSEGYLIHQFLCPKTNQRTDDYGGNDYQNRIRFPLEIVREIRSALPSNFIIMFRLSMLDLVDNTSTWEEVVQLAKELQQAGVTIINTGIGWHEARVPTIATCVPRGAFTWVTQQMKDVLGPTTPLCTTNRINTPDKIEHVLKTGQADLVSMARPFLADPNFIIKSYENKHEEINTCIACNQACLDHVFEGKRASCLVNPRACHELELPPINETQNQTDALAESAVVPTVERTTAPKKVAVIGAGPAGLATATTFASLGHDVTLYDKHETIGGQFNMAKRIPGKREFYETIRYFDTMMKKYGVKKQLGTWIESLADLCAEDNTPPDVIVIATGVLPRTPPIPNIYKHPKIVSYVDVLTNKVQVGEKVAIIGAGGIGVDVAEYLLHSKGWDANDTPPPANSPAEESEVNEFFKEWDVDKTNWSHKEISTNRGGLIPPNKREQFPPQRQITLMQRKPGKIGATLGKTTGWIHRAQLDKGNVEKLSNCSYDTFDDDGNLHITIGSSNRRKKGEDSSSADEKRILEVDHVVVCAGQEKCDGLVDPLQEELSKTGGGGQVFVVGGAYEAGELDAKRAINMGTRLAYAVHKHGIDDRNVVLRDVIGQRPVEDEELLVQMLNKLSGKKR